LEEVENPGFENLTSSYHRRELGGFLMRQFPGVMDCGVMEFWSIGFYWDMKLS
jgi:hypothetical protein